MKRTLVVVATKSRQGWKRKSWVACYHHPDDPPGQKQVYGIPVEWFYPKWRNGDTFEVTVQRVKKRKVNKPNIVWV